MRYFITLLILLGVVILSIAGFRGASTQRTPIEVFPDMDRQPRLRPQTDNNFFADGLSSQKPVPGTVARGEPYQEIPKNTGMEPGTTNFVETIPIPVTAQLMERGRERYEIYCAPCHGSTGAGNGITTQFGMVTIANFHDYTIRQMVRRPDGDLYNTITNGKNLMGGYGSKLSVRDRWAVVAYVRALQRSRLAVMEDVPQSERSNLQ